MRRKIIFSLLFMTLTPVTSYSDELLEERVKKLERALISIEGKIDKLLAPVVSNSGGNTESNNKNNKPADVVYEPGLWMEFYKINLTNKNIPETVNGVSLGVIKDKNVSSLKYSSFRSDPSLEHYYRDYFGLLWNGNLEIRKSGNHILGIDLVIDSKPQFHSNCVSSMSLSGKQIVKASVGISYAHKKIVSDLKDFDLKEGLYPISVWLACRINGDIRFIDGRLEGVSTVIKHRGPDGKSIGPINSSRLVHRAN